MKQAPFLLLALVCISAVVGHGQERGFVVVAHPDLETDSVTRNDLKRIFLKFKSRWPSGERAKPVDQRFDAAIRLAFSQRILGKSLAAVESYWNGQVFAGKDSPPPMLGSDQEVLQYIKQNPGAVGYISDASGQIGVKVLRVRD